jgi:hypothetical protein
MTISTEQIVMYPDLCPGGQKLTDQNPATAPDPKHCFWGGSALTLKENTAFVPM